MSEQMATSVDLRDWRQVLMPCPTMPEPIATYVFTANSITEAKAKVINVLDKYGIPHVAFPDDNNIVSCRMRFIFDRNDNTILFELDLDHIQIDFSQNPRQTLTQASKRAMDIIEFTIKLLREMGFVNNENETKVRNSMLRSWSEWIEVPRALLPIFLGKLMRSD